MLARRHTRSRSSRTLASIVLATAVLVAPGAARAQTVDARPTVAILDFANGAIGAEHAELEPLGGGIGDLLVAEMASNPAIRLVERKQVRRLLEEQGLVESRQVDAATAARIGRLLGAQHLIVGGFVTDRSGAMQLHARAVSVETGEIVHVERVADRTDNVVALVGQLAARLNVGLRLPAAPARELGASTPAVPSTASAPAVPAASAPGAKPARLPFEAVLLYSRAVRAEDSGDRVQAVELYRKVLGEFPSYTPARRALARVADR